MNFHTKLGLITLAIIFGLIILSRFLSSDTKLLGVTISRSWNIEFENPGLRKVVQNNLEGKEGIYGVVIESLINDKENYSYNDNLPFPAASLYKLVLMAAVLKEVENGEWKLEDKVVNTKSTLEKIYGGVDFGYEDSEEEIGYSIEEALIRVGTISDNFAAIMLSEKLRKAYNAKSSSGLLTGMAKELEMFSTDFAAIPTSTTPADIALYFNKLYKGGVVSKSSSDKIVEIVSRSRLNNRIPAYLPVRPPDPPGAEGLQIAHKTGELSRVRHDAGIIYLENNPYLLVLMSQDLKDENVGVETLAQISKDVYDYFKGNQNKGQ